jgi:antitoxin YefM
MEAISHTAVQENLAATMTKVCRDKRPIIITRNDEQSVVMLSLEDYESLEETAYLLQSSANAKRLLAAKEALDSGHGLIRSVDLSQ